MYKRKFEHISDIPVTFEEHLKITGLCGEIFLIDTWENSEKYAEEILKASPKMIGFDIEATNEIASVITIASEKSVYLFHVFKISKNRLSDGLRKIITTHEIIKVIHGYVDHRYLKHYGVHLSATVNLQCMAKILEYPENSKKLYAHLFPNFPPMIELYRERDTFIDWNKELSGAMRLYAAHDAKANLLIIKKILHI